MVGGTTHQPQQAPQLAPPSSTAPTTTPEEDELVKRNTDCVYFLASPLTCKKGSECEYRHSEVARVNPRDCYYWLNGNCLNPKCAFRHPPLDGLLGSDVATPVVPPVPAPHPTPYTTTPKQGVACIFFQKGFCLKGHLCPFSHGPPNPVNNKVSQSGPVNPVPAPPKMSHSGPEKSIQEPKFTQPPPVQKQAPKMQQPSMTFEEPPRYKSTRVVPPPVTNEIPVSKPNRGAYHVMENDRVINGKDAEEYSREPSPGFDVLVETEHEDSEYYREKEEFGRSRGQDYDIDRPVDHGVDRDMYRDYDRFNERDGQFSWDDRRSSYPKSDSPDYYKESDLRNRLSKQRRGSDNGSRSVVSRDRHADRTDRTDRNRDSHADRTDRRDRGSYHHRPEQGALSSRLRGRIKIPEENNSRVEREFDIGRRQQSRYSPGRPLSVNQISRLQDRIQVNYSNINNTNNDLRDYRGLRGHRDINNTSETNDNKFAGPKRLSELKGRIGENHEQVSGKRKLPEDDNLSFEGPKPLSEILKRKKGVENRVINNIEDNNNNNKEIEIVSESNVVNDFEEEKKMDSSNIEEGELNYDENEGGMIDEDALVDEELEAYDQKDGEYDYDNIEGEEEDYNLDEGEYVDEEEGEENVVYE